MAAQFLRTRGGSLINLAYVRAIYKDEDGVVRAMFDEEPGRRLVPVALPATMTINDITNLLNAYEAQVI